MVLLLDFIASDVSIKYSIVFETISCGLSGSALAPENKQKNSKNGIVCDSIRIFNSFTSDILVTYSEQLKRYLCSLNHKTEQEASWPKLGSGSVQVIIEVTDKWPREPNKIRALISLTATAQPLLLLEDLVSEIMARKRLAMATSYR